MLLKSIKYLIIYLIVLILILVLVITNVIICLTDKIYQILTCVVFLKVSLSCSAIISSGINSKK